MVIVHEKVKLINDLWQNANSILLHKKSDMPHKPSSGIHPWLVRETPLRAQALNVAFR